jgi:hypothetical protein
MPSSSQETNMANVSAPNGLTPFAPGGGAPPSFALRPVQIAFGNTNKMFKGDPVKILTSGFIDAWVAGNSVNILSGIFWGCEYLSTIRGYTVSPFWPGAGDVSSTSKVTAYIYPLDMAGPPQMWLLAQSDSSGLAQSDVGANIDVNMGTGNVSTGISGAFLAGPSATTATFPFRIMRLYSDFGGIDNGSQAGAFNKVFVAPNFAGLAGV